MTPTPEGQGAIPADVLERAEILMDQFRHVEDDRELIARVLMSMMAPQPRLGLTPQQQQALKFIATFINLHGASPSYSEIADGLGFSSKGPVHALIHQLVDRGAITIGAQRARSISVVGSA